MKLPNEILALIIEKLSLESVFNMALVNGTSYNLVKIIYKPTVVYYPNTNLIKYKEWNDKYSGKRKIMYWINGKIKSEMWKYKTKFHRENGPAIQDWLEFGLKYLECWFKNGKLHRIGGPAQTEWLENSSVYMEKWFYQGKLYRLNGPSIVKYSLNAVVYEVWYKDGKIHRTNGPAIIEYNFLTKRHRTVWYENGVYQKETYTSQPFLQKLKSMFV